MMSGGCPTQKEHVSLSSTHSTRVSLDAVKHGKAGLDARRTALLSKVPESNDWAEFKHESLEMIDLAYLTAKTGDEFAILRGKNSDILFHGINCRCDVLDDKTLKEGLVSHRFELYGHSHPGESFPDPSADDRLFLKYLGQERSKLISGMNGICIEYEAIL